MCLILINIFLTNKPNFIAYSLVQTLANNKEKHAASQIRRAEGVIELCGRISRPGIEHFRGMLDSNQITNCPCTSKDDIIVEDVIGKDMPTIRVRTIRQRLTQIPALNTQQVPESLREHHKDVRLFADVRWFMKIPFVHATSENIGLRTATPMHDRKMKSLKKDMFSAFSLCATNNFNIATMDVDLEFEYFKPHLPT